MNTTRMEIHKRWTECIIICTTFICFTFTLRGCTVNTKFKDEPEPIYSVEQDPLNQRKNLMTTLRIPEEDFDPDGLNFWFPKGTLEMDNGDVYEVKNICILPGDVVPAESMKSECTIQIVGHYEPIHQTQQDQNEEVGNGDDKEGS